MNETLVFGSSVPELSAVAQLKSSLLMLLGGQFAGLVLVGRAVWKSLIAPARANAAIPAPAAAATGSPS